MNRQSKIDGRSQCMGATAAMGNWVRRRGWKMVMAMAKAACEAADRVAPTMGPWWRSGDGGNGGSSEREEVQRWPSRARTGRAKTVEIVRRAKGQKNGRPKSNDRRGSRSSENREREQVQRWIRAERGQQSESRSSGNGREQGEQERTMIEREQVQTWTGVENRWS